MIGDGGAHDSRGFRFVAQAGVWREQPLRGATDAKQKLDAIVNYAGRVVVASSQSAGG